jgi:uncharacterized protein YcgI (DUF1989 family)
MIDLTLLPGTGKALELRAGTVLRIEQISGGQCVDFNCFNLADYREHLHVGRTRTVHGLNPTKGDYLWSAPPRERQMMFILEDTARCNDTLFPGCSAFLYETRYGFLDHTNCRDIQSEAQREYGLTPDDVHDSLNLFMSTSVIDGRPVIHKQTTKPGDYVELLALIDVLAVPNVCGDDVMLNSNFSLKPVRIQLRQATNSELTLPRIVKGRNQKTAADFRQSIIKTDRKLKRDPTYVPEFTNVPVTECVVSVELTEEEVKKLNVLHSVDRYGEDIGASLRDVLFSWLHDKAPSLLGI